MKNSKIVALNPNEHYRKEGKYFFFILGWESNVKIESQIEKKCKKGN